MQVQNKQNIKFTGKWNGLKIKGKHADKINEALMGNLQGVRKSSLKVGSQSDKVDMMIMESDHQGDLLILSTVKNKIGQKIKQDSMYPDKDSNRIYSKYRITNDGLHEIHVSKHSLATIKEKKLSDLNPKNLGPALGDILAKAVERLKG